MFSRMPVPVWDSDMVFLDEPVDTATVVSDDIWKKFDLDVPLDNYHHRYQNDLFDDGSITISQMPHEIPMTLHFDHKSHCQEREDKEKRDEIRHHDCMWAGLCISKEHNRTHPTKKDNQIHRRPIQAGRSLLINKNPQHQQNQRSLQTSGSSIHSHTTKATNNSNYQQNGCSRAATTSKNLESDGDSTRPETPQSSESETESEDDEPPVFRHEQINIDDIVSMPVSEVTGQQIQRRPGFNQFDRRKEDEKIAMEKAQLSKETVIRNTLMSDHCYHLNQQPISSKKLEHLGVQTPSDSEEEIDVVSYDKPTRPATTIAASLPTYPSPADQQHFQLTVNTAFKERHSNSTTNNTNNQATISNPVPVPIIPTPRPRGRPPTNPASRKRAAQVAAAAAAAAAAQAAAAQAAAAQAAAVSSQMQIDSSKPAKRARHRNYQRRASPQKNQKSAPTTPTKQSTSSRSSSDDEPDTEKRSLHNNMERQRRIELRNAFEDLRILVPEVEAKEKAPKVAILRQAAAYCDRLTDLEQINSTKVMELKKRQERLRAQLSQLRRNLAMHR